MSEINFTPYITDHTLGFTGREWVMQRIQAWIAAPDAPRLFVLTGEPGAGKSALAARLVQNGKTQAHHFCIARQASTVDPLTFTRLLSLQLAALDGFAVQLLEEARIHLHINIQVGENYGQIIGVQIENLIVKAPSSVEAFNLTVVSPLVKLSSDHLPEKVLILVDGLDEADEHPGLVKIANLLANTADLPAQVRLLITTRPESSGLRQLSDLPQIRVDLIADEPERFGDANQYILRQVACSPGLRKRLRTAGKSAAGFINELEPKHSGNFRYLSLLLKAVESGEVWASDLERLPPGLDGIYREHLRTRALGRQALWRAYRPVLGVLAAAQEALPAGQIQKFSGISMQKIRDVLQDIGQFVEKTNASPPNYQVYHQSLVDFLGDPDRAQEFWIDLKAVHRKISKTYSAFLKTRNWEQCDRYGILHLASHLYRGGLTDGLFTLLDERRMHVRYHHDRYQYAGWLREVELVWQAAAGQDESSARARMLIEQIAIQARCALSLASVRSLARNTTPELLYQLVARGLWELDRAVSLINQIIDAPTQQRCLCALKRIVTLTDAQKSELAEMLRAYGAVDVCDESTNEIEQIPGYPFHLNSIRPQGRIRVEKFLAELIEGRQFNQPVHSLRKSPLVAILEDELAPETIEKPLRSHWFFQQLGIKPSTDAFVQNKAQNSAAAALALSLGFTQSLTERYFSDALAWVRSLGDARSKATGLWALAPFVTQAVEEEVLAAVSRLPEGELRQAAVDRLAAHLSTPGIDQIAQSLLAIREDETSRMLLLARLVPLFKDNGLQQAALSRAMALADGRTGSEAELGTRVYAELANWLTPQEMERAIFRCRSLSYRNSGSLARLLPFVSSERKMELVKEAVAKPLEYEMESYHGPALVQLGGYLNAERLEAALAFHGYYNWREPLDWLRGIRTATSPQERAAACVEPFLAITHKYFGSTYRDCLISLLPHIQKTHLPGALSLIEKHHEPLNQNCAWILLATKMGAGEREHHLSRVMENLTTVVDEERALLIGLTAEYHSDWFKVNAVPYFDMMELLMHSAALKGRSAVMKCMLDLLPAWLTIGGRETAEGLCQAVLEICEAWHWM